MTQNDRQQRMAERILEDERLRGDLEDDAATALVDWASKRAAAAAADPARPDAAVEAEVEAIRKAARAAARSGETEPQRLIGLAEARLAPGAAVSAGPAQPAASAASANVPESAERSAAPAASAATAQAARPEAQTGGALPDGVSSAQSASAPAPRRRRKRNRMARFLKRIQGGR